MKKLIFLFFYLLSHLTSVAQDSSYYQYNSIIDAALTLQDSGEYDNSCHYFDSAFQIITFVPYHHFDAFQAAINNSDFHRGLKYLIQCPIHGLDTDFFSSPELDLFNKSDLAKTYYAMKDSLLQVHYNSIDYEYYQTLVIMKIRDQEVRNANNPIMLKNDSLNFTELLALTKKKGFPTFEKTGYGFNMAWLILWHQRGDNYPDKFLWPEILPYIQEEINRGKITPRFFDMFEEFKKK